MIEIYEKASGTAAVWIWPLLLIFIVWLWWPFEALFDEVTAYPASCVNGYHILPVRFYRDNPQEDFSIAKARLEIAKEHCFISKGKPQTYRINKSTNDVHYKMPISGAAKLVNCSIYNRKDWFCEYPDYQTGIYDSTDSSGKFGFIDGMPAISAKEAARKPYQTFYLKRWQWLMVSGMGYFIYPVRAPWLIPEQLEGVY